MPDRVSWIPDLSELRGYSWARARLDIQSGLTVAIFAVPQAMAYAMLVGVAPVYGLYAAMVMSLVAALWGSSPYLNTGPTNSAALLAFAAVLPFLDGHGPLPALFVFTLLVGILRMSFGLLRLGALVDYVSESVLLGFTVGTGVLIATGQIHYMLGVEGSRNPWFVQRMVEVFSRIPACNTYAVAIALGTLVLMVALDRYGRKFPVVLATIVLATVVAELLGDRGALQRVQDIAGVKPGLPAFRMYPISLDMVFHLLPAATAAAVVGLMEAVTIGQVLGLRHGQRINVNQEFFGQGLSHVVGAFFQGIPGSGSFGRSALIEQTGAQTRLANVFFALFTGLALLSVARWLNLIPIAALSGLLLYIAYKLINLERIRQVWQISPRGDTAVMALTFAVTVFWRIEYGLFAGVIGAMAVHLHRARKLHLHEMVPEGGVRFREVPYDGSAAHEPSDLVVLALHGEMFFGLAHRLRDTLSDVVIDQGPSRIVLRIRRAFSIDYSCWSALFDFARAYRRRGGELYLCGMDEVDVDVVQHAGMFKVIPRENLYVHKPGVFKAMREAVAAAVESLGDQPAFSPAWAAYLEDTGLARISEAPADDAPGEPPASRRDAG